MSQSQTSSGAREKSREGDDRIDISTADDMNVDEDNAVGSPKEGLTAEAPVESESDIGDDDEHESRQDPDGEVAPGTK